MKPEIIMQPQSFTLQPNRRTFIKTSGILCAGLAAMPALSLAEPTHTEPGRASISHAFEWLGGV